MGVQFELINLDKKELISFYGIDTGTKLRELSGTIIAGNIVTWYLLHNTGDRISFVNDTEETQVLFGNSYHLLDFSSFTDVTLRIINELIEAEILQSAGARKIDDEFTTMTFNNIWDPAIKGNN
jgi:hypothetical protein